MQSKLGPLQALGKFWGTLNNTQRFICTAFLSLSVVLLMVVSIVATRPHMGVLFSGLESDDAGVIISKLQEKGVPYKVEGGTIKVPEKYVHETRIQLAGEGLPQSSNVGFEIFDKSSLGMTEFSQRMSYQRALQGELSRTINQIDGVVQSRVHIVVPKPSVFSEQEKEATASVFLKLRPGTRLGGDRVAGIVHLVSSAVEGLKPNQVSVLDTNGNLLSEPGGDGGGLDPRMTSSQLKLKRDYEQQMERDIQSMLERVVGAGKAIVRVNAKINLDRTETNRETYVPLENGSAGVLLSEEKVEENYNNRTGAPGGVVGVRGTPSPGVGDEGGYSRTSATNKYEVSKMVEHTVKAPGEIERLSVAVMLDATVDAAKIPAIRNAVATASGIDESGRDQITVESLDFDNSAMEAEEKELKAMASRATYMDIGKTVGAVVLLLAFLFLLKGLMGKVNISLPERVAVEEVHTGEIPAPAAHAGSAHAGPAPVGAPAAAPAPAVAQAYQQVVAVAPGNGGSPVPSAVQVPPEEVAQVLRKWMSEN